MKKVYLPKLKKISVENYSFYEQIPTFDFNFNDGISAIIGANGVGKTTFINLIIYSIVGFEKVIKGKGKNKKITYLNSSYFSDRLDKTVEKEYNQKASVKLEFILNKTNIKITRSLIENKITNLQIDNIINQEDTSLDYFENILCRLSNIPEFKDFELIIREFLLFDESRKNVAWREDAQDEILRILLLDANFQSEYQRLEQSIVEYDSKGRHASEDIRMAENAYDDLILEGQKLKVSDENITTPANNLNNLFKKKLSLQNEIESLNIQFEDNTKIIENLNTKINILLSEKETVKIHIEEIDKIINESEAKLYSSYYNKFPDYYYTLQTSLCRSGKCLICESSSKELKVLHNNMMKENKCLICGSSITESAVIDDNELVSKINTLNEKRIELINTFENATATVLRLTESLENTKNEIINISNSINSFKKNLIMIESEILQAENVEKYDTYSEILKSKEKSIAHLIKKKDEYYALRDNAKKDLNRYVASFRNTIRSINKSLSFYFNKYAKTFIGWNCELTLKEKTIKNIPHTYYLPKIDDTVRDNTDAVSESQRFFLDQAFRMAIINYLQDTIEGFSTFFITETPEGSLDLIYEKQVAKMFIKFSETGNNIIFTSNLNSSNFLSTLFENFSTSDYENRILNLLYYSKLSELQKVDKPSFINLYNSILEGNSNYV